MDSLKKLIGRSLTHLRKQISRHFWSTHLPAQSIHGILQARMLQWVAIPFSKGSSWTRDQTHMSYVSCIVGGFFMAESPGNPGMESGGKRRSCLAGKSAKQGKDVMRSELE